MTKETRAVRTRSETTKEAILEAIRKLIATNGVGGLTVRQIIRESGQKNESALHYHFGSLDKAIIEASMGILRRIEAKRQVAFDDLSGIKEPTLAQLLTAHIRPIAEVIDEDEDAAYYPGYAVHISNSSRVDLLETFQDLELDVTARALALLLERMQSVPERLRGTVWRMMINLTMTTLKYWRETDSAELNVDEIVDVIVRSVVAVADAHGVRSGRS